MVLRILKKKTKSALNTINTFQKTIVMANKNYQRRKFIKNGALAMSAFTIVPRHVIGKGFVAPSDKLRIAGIGVGGKGQGDISEFAKSPNVDIVALVDVDDRAAAKSRQSFPKANYYHDFREMLEKEKNNIDACSISTPDNTGINWCRIDWRGNACAVLDQQTSMATRYSNSFWKV